MYLIRCICYAPHSFKSKWTGTRLPEEKASPIGAYMGTLVMCAGESLFHIYMSRLAEIDGGGTEESRERAFSAMILFRLWNTISRKRE